MILMARAGPFGHKYLDADSVEYATVLAAQGDKTQEQRVRETLQAALKLLVPVWGGAYQYSTGGNWNEPTLRETSLHPGASNANLRAVPTAISAHLNTSPPPKMYIASFVNSLLAPKAPSTSVRTPM